MVTFQITDYWIGNTEALSQLYLWFHRVSLTEDNPVVQSLDEQIDNVGNHSTSWRSVEQPHVLVQPEIPQD